MLSSQREWFEKWDRINWRGHKFLFLNPTPLFLSIYAPWSWKAQPIANELQKNRDPWTKTTLQQSAANGLQKNQNPSMKTTSTTGVIAISVATCKNRLLFRENRRSSEWDLSMTLSSTLPILSPSIAVQKTSRWVLECVWQIRAAGLIAIMELDWGQVGRHYWQEDQSTYQPGSIHGNRYAKVARTASPAAILKHGEWISDTIGL